MNKAKRARYTHEFARDSFFGARSLLATLRHMDAGKR
jgi:hypothetical protein